MIGASSELKMQRLQPQDACQRALDMIGGFFMPIVAGGGTWDEPRGQSRIDQLHLGDSYITPTMRAF